MARGRPLGCKAAADVRLILHFRSGVRQTYRMTIHGSLDSAPHRLRSPLRFRQGGGLALPRRLRPAYAPCKRQFPCRFTERGLGKHEQGNRSLNSNQGGTVWRTRQAVETGARGGIRGTHGSAAADPCHPACRPFSECDCPERMMRLGGERKNLGSRSGMIRARQNRRRGLALRVNRVMIPALAQMLLGGP